MLTKMYQQQMFNVLNTSFSIGCAGESAPRMFFLQKLQQSLG